MNTIPEPSPFFSLDAVLPTDSFTDSMDKSFGTISLKDLHGHWVLLFFFPLAFTFVCPTEIIAYSDRHAEFAAKNCHVLGISCDSKYSLLAWSNKSRSDGGLGPLKIPLLSDFNKEIAKSYGVLTADGTTLRGTFIISPNGILCHASVNDAPIGRSVDESIRVLAALQANDTLVTNPVSHNFNQQVDDNLTKVSFSRQLPLNLNSSSTSSSTQIRNIFSPIVSVLKWYNQLLKQHPIATKSITSCVIGIMGELIGSYVKRLYNKRKNDSNATLTISSWAKDISLQRIAVFGFYGLGITGPFFHWWYSFLESLVTAESGLLGLGPKTNRNLLFLMKLSINQLVMTPPFLLFTIAYIQYFLSLNVNDTIKAIKRNFVAALITNWKIWTVAQAVNFRVVPIDYRVLFGNVVALWWNVYLSIVSS
eukprot:gene14438-19375_t